MYIILYILIDIYNELLTSLSSELPVNIKLLSKYRLDEYFESKGELKPYYDLRIENHFAFNYQS